VSVITPSLNQGQFIRQTIESVLCQDYPRVEYLIVDGGSMDETAGVVEEYGDRLRWISEPDEGQSHAINKGFRLAQGEILAWLNADDILLPGAIRHAVEALEQNPQAGFVYGGGRFLEEDGSVGDPFPHTQPFDLWRLTYVNDYILQQSCFFRRWAVEAVGFVDESLHWGMDWDLLIRLGKRFPVVYVPQELACIREHPAAKTASGGGRRFRELARILRRHTGQSYPPGYFIYGLDNWKKGLRQLLRRRLPKALAGPLETAASLIADPMIQRNLDAQGWYRDGWAGPKVHLMLPPGNGRLKLEGSVPNWWTGYDAQEITVLQNGKPLVDLSLPPGRFVRYVPLESSDRPVELTLRAWDWVRERGGGRKLAYRLTAAGWAPAVGKPPQRREATEELPSFQ
jgi:glycosyltransferase involved in cell wall biosynthesis